MKKRGVSSTVFVFIFMIILIGFILIFSYDQIGNILDIGEKSKWILFQDNLRDEVNEIYTKNEGSRYVYAVEYKKPLGLPSDVGKICFKDDGSLDITDLTEREKLILESRSENVVVFESDYNSFNVENLKPNVNPLCIDTSNQLSIILENKFDGNTYVEISKYEGTDTI
jgi:hypothetical protein